MSIPSGENAFDVDLFRKLLRGVDSTREGEPETAFRRAMKLCAESAIRFCDALALAYGRNGHVEELEARLAQEQEWREEMERHIASLPEGEEQGAVKGRLADVWESPNVRLFVLACVIALGQLLYTVLLDAGQSGFAVASLLVAIPAALALFGTWIYRDFQENGLWQTLLKTLIFGSGFSLGTQTFCDGSWDCTPSEAWTHFYFAGGLLIVTTLLTASRLSAWLADRLSHLF